MKRGAFVVWLVLASFRTAFGQDDVASRMQGWSRSLGVECTHCHVAGRWSDQTVPAYAFAQRMVRMVNAVNAGPLAALGAVTCWTCHRGRAIPARLPRASWEAMRAANAQEFEVNPNRALTMSVYAASLGVGCSFCHDADRATSGKPAKAMVARMLPIFDEIPKHFEPSRVPVTQCFMCHQGKVKPEREPALAP
jgi:Photosynthetic reaction centre cytochrome C subunit